MTIRIVQYSYAILVLPGFCEKDARKEFRFDIWGIRCIDKCGLTIYISFWIIALSILVKFATGWPRLVTGAGCSVEIGPSCTLKHDSSLHSRLITHHTPQWRRCKANCDWPIFTFFVCLLRLFMPTLVSWSFWYIFLIFDKIAKTRITELPCDLPCDGEYYEEMTARITVRNEDDWNWN